MSSKILGLSITLFMAEENSLSDCAIKILSSFDKPTRPSADSGVLSTGTP